MRTARGTPAGVAALVHQPIRAQVSPEERLRATVVSTDSAGRIRGSGTMRRFLNAVLVAISAAACTTWHPVSPTPSQPAELNHGGWIRITQTAGGTIELRGARLSDDTLFARTDGGPIAIPMSEIRRIELRQVNGTRTTWLVVGTVGIAILALVGLAASAPAIGYQ